MKIAVDAGHNVPYDSGAVGIKKEDDLTRAVANSVIGLLRKLGHLVTDCTPVTATSLGDSLYKRVTVANRDDVDFFLCIHFNAGGGHGVEAYAISSAGQLNARKLCEEVSSLGFYNRGVKDGSNLYVVKNTNAVAVLLEVGFIDSASDMALYDQLGPDKIAAAIVKALTGQTVSADPAPAAPAQSINERIDNMQVIDVQRLCNKLGVTDYEGKALVEDNVSGPRTESARAKLKEILNYVLR